MATGPGPKQAAVRPEAKTTKMDMFPFCSPAPTRDGNLRWTVIEYDDKGNLKLVKLMNPVDFLILRPLFWPFVKKGRTVRLYCGANKVYNSIDNHKIIPECRTYPGHCSYCHSRCLCLVFNNHHFMYSIFLLCIPSRWIG